MRHFHVLGLLTLLGVLLVACGPKDVLLSAPKAEALAPAKVVQAISTTEPEMESPAAVQATQPTGTSEPPRERPNRSHPASTGYPGFRKYYQIRCYPGCHSYPSTPEPTKVHP